jgi:excisionase family DNA binding protein
LRPLENRKIRIASYASKMYNRNINTKKEGYISMAKPEDEAMLKPKDVAARLNVSRTTVTRWIQQGKLRATRLGEKLYLISEKDLAEFLEGGKEK